METSALTQRVPAEQGEHHAGSQVQVETDRFRKGVLYSLIRYGLSLITGFGYWMASAHLLGASVIGVVSLLTSILGLFRPLSTLGEQFALIPALNRYQAHDQRSIRLFGVVTAISAGITLLLSIPYGLFAVAMLVNVYHQPSLIPLLLVYMIGFYSVYNLMGMFAVPFLAYQEVKYSAIAEMASGMARIVILLGMVWWFGAAPLSGIVAQVGAFIVGALILAWCLPKLFPRLERPKSYDGLKQDLTSVYRYSLKSLPATASISILQHADRLILGYYISPSLLGVYTLAYALFERVLMMGTSYEDMVFSSSSRAWANQEATLMSQIYRSALRRSYFWVTPILVMSIGFSDVLLGLFGHEFVQGHVALSVLLAGLLFDNFARITTGLIGGINQPGFKAMIVGLGAATNLGLSLALIPHWGISGAASANTLGYLVTALLCGVWLQRHSHIPLLTRSIIQDLVLLAVLNGALIALMWVIRYGMHAHLLWAMGGCGFAMALYYVLGRKWLRNQEIYHP